MIHFIRSLFNEAFTDALYTKYLSEINKPFPNSLDFRVAETPIFIDQKFTAQLLELGNYVNEVIMGEEFKLITQPALVDQLVIPNEPDFPACIVMDFAVAKNDENEIVPALIELQGFPSLFAFELLQDEAIKNTYDIPHGFTPYLNSYTKDKYITHLERVIKGNPVTNQKKHTVLLEILPHQQKTRIDFYCTNEYLNIPIVCITEIFNKGNKLFYKRDGIQFQIDRIYNRIVMDELKKQTKSIQEKGNIFQTELAIEWVTHPNHFFRISKFLMPYLTHPYIPKTQFVHQLTSIPTNLDEYILKPLFSFAGQGVIIDIQKGDIEKITNPEKWILQEKVHYSECIETPTGPAKAEIRLFYFWDETQHKYVATMNLARLSKGKMIGVDYNKTATWVGGSLAYFEQL